MATKQAVFLINISILTINENTLFLSFFWGVFADSFVRFAKGLAAKTGRGVMLVNMAPENGLNQLETAKKY